MRSSLLMALSLVFTAFAGAQNSTFKQGEELFMRNKPQEAVTPLEAAFYEDPANIQAALYLGIAYQQLSRPEDAIAVLRKALPRAGTRLPLVAFNLGNAYFFKGSASFAEQYYTQAIQGDPNYASAYLNRANSRLRTGALADAVVDYDAYLVLEPSSPKRPQIEQVLALIRQEFAAAERREAASAEQARLEAERRQRLLDEVSASLQAAAEETQGVQAGSEAVQNYDGEFILE